MLSKKSRYRSDGRLRESWARARKWDRWASGSSTVMTNWTTHGLGELLRIEEPGHQVGALEDEVGVLHHRPAHQGMGPHRHRRRLLPEPDDDGIGAAGQRVAHEVDGVEARRVERRHELLGEHRPHDLADGVGGDDPGDTQAGGELGCDRRLAHARRPADQDDQGPVDPVHHLPLGERVGVALPDLLHQHPAGQLGQLRPRDRRRPPVVKPLLDPLRHVEGPGGGSPVAMIELAISPLEYGRACSSSDMTMWRGFCVIDGWSHVGSGLPGTAPPPRRRQRGRAVRAARRPGDQHLVVGVDDPHPPLQGEPGGEVDRRRFQLGDEYVSPAGGLQIGSEPGTVRQRRAVTDDGGAVRLEMCRQDPRHGRWCRGGEKDGISGDRPERPRPERGVNDRNLWNEPPDAILEGRHRAQIGKRLFHQCNHHQVGQQQRVSAQIPEQKLGIGGRPGPDHAHGGVGVDRGDARARSPRRPAAPRAGRWPAPRPGRRWRWPAPRPGRRRTGGCRW